MQLDLHHGLLSLLLCLVLMELLPQAAGDPRGAGAASVPPQYVQVLRLIGGSEYRKAIAEAEALIRTQPNFDRGYLALVDASEGANALDSAVSYFEALVGEHPGSGYPHYGLGLAYQRKRDYHGSIESLKRSIERSPELAAAFLELAYSYRRLGSLKDALPYLEQVRERHAETAAVYYGLGCAYHFLGNAEKGLEHLDRALAIDPWLLDGYRIKGQVHLRRGRFRESLPVYERLLELAQERQDLWYAGDALNSLGAASDGLGDYARAIRSYRRALEAHRAIGNRQGEASTLNNIGVIHDKLGEYSAAADAYRDALKACRTIKDRKCEGTALHNIGVMHAKKEAYPTARRYYGLALAIRKEIHDRQGEGYTLNDIGVAYAREGDRQAALKYLRLALDVRQAAGDKLGETMSLYSLGSVYEQAGEYREAWDYQTKALAQAEALNHRESLWRSHAGIASALKGQGRLVDALGYYRAAIDTIEGIRADLQVDEYKAGFFQSKVQVYEGLIDLLYSRHSTAPVEGADREAFEYAERARARAFLDLLAESIADVRQGMSQPEVEEEHAVLRELARIQRALLNRGTPLKERDRLELELKAEEARLEDLKGRLRVSNARYADLRYPQPYDVARIEALLREERAVLLAFLLGEERSFGWLIAPGQVKMAVLPGRAAIEGRVRAYHRLLSSPPAGVDAFDRWHTLAGDLSKMLLGSFGNDWKTARRLIIVPDGILHYLPFETLVESWSGRARPHYLVEGHDITYAPSASVIGTLRARRAEAGGRLAFLGFADPPLGSRAAPAQRATGRTDRPRIGADRAPEIVRGFYQRQGATFERLPYARREVTDIAALYPPELRKTYLGTRATESAVKAEDLTRYRRIHFATHGLIDEEVPRRSGLVLSLEEREEDGLLQMHEILNLRLQADLVVLSACQSGLGKLVKGEGIVGVARAFLGAGASGLVVSLWNVNDESTAVFMKSFYRHLESGRGAADALARAKHEMIASATPAYRFPYYWAPFVLSGRGG